MKFATFAHFLLFVVSSAASEISLEDAGRGELCAESRKREIAYLYSRREQESRGRTC